MVLLRVLSLFIFSVFLLGATCETKEDHHRRQSDQEQTTETGDDESVESGGDEVDYDIDLDGSDS